MAQGISIPVVQSGLEASIQQGVKNVGTININASVDPSSFKNLAQPLGRVSGLATEFEKSIAASNARVLAFGASVGIINGVQNAFSALVTTGIEVQKTLADIGAISGRSGAELSKFGDSLFEIGKITGQTFQTASQAALEFSRQGLTVEQTLKRTSDALTLTRFTTLSASEAVDVLTAAANSFSETGITTAQIINKLVAVDTKFAVSAEDLAKGLARAGSIAQEVGVNFDQLNAAVTVAQERTARGGAVIGNALKTIFTRLRSDETVQALRNIGVESLDAQGQLKGAIPLLEELSKKLQGLSGGERVQILEAVASKYNINILSALLNDLGTANSKFGQAVQVSAGAGNQAYERQIELNKTLASQLNNATVSATQLLNKLAEIGVTQNLNSLLSFVNDLLSGFNKLLDSGSVGGDIAKGLIKGISDVFFTVGLPILAAIFIKLTTDIAKFGVESLKTILGINQQVRERQALEQAVVNTLIRDQEVMASILALSGNRAKQEEYLLGVYNRQLTALQQVQSIASSVTPGLMAGGLSATSGQIKKRSAGGYLPSQEAADVRRGVGGASASSRVVSIPNFAFGGGKRGTMIANTSEYVVPNFANGGSAIFNQDMARAYGLPAGAKKISAAGGYVPKFAEKQKDLIQESAKYAGLFAQEQLKANPNQLAVINPDTGKASLANGNKIDKDGVNLIVQSFPAKSNAEFGQVDSIRKEIEEEGQNFAVKYAMDFARAFNPDAKLNIEAIKERAKQANMNKGAVQAFVGTTFEAGVSGILKGEDFVKSQGRSAISPFDFEGTDEIRKAFNIPESVKFIETKNQQNDSNLKSIAEKIYRIEKSKETKNELSPLQDKKFDYLDDASRRNGKRKARAYEGKDGKYYIEKQLDKFEVTSERPTVSETDIRNLQFGSKKYERTPARSAFGYIPNFAQGGPLEDAIQREMAAGLDPSQIRITKDGKLKNSQNPNGFAVINTRDEPNGRVPNFARPIGPETEEQMQQREARNTRARERRAENSGQEDDTNKSLLSTNKLMLAFTGLTLVTNQLQSNIKDTTSGFYAISTGLTQAATAAAGFSAIGNMLKDSGFGKGKIGQINKKSKFGGGVGGLQGTGFGKGGIGGMIAGALGSAIKFLPVAGSIYAGLESGIRSGFEFAQANVDNVAEKGKGTADVANATKKDDILKKMQEVRGKMQSSPNDDRTNASYDELRKKLRVILDTEKEAATQTKKKQDDLDKDNIELGKRVALATKINDLNISFNEGENKAFSKRSAAQSDFIRNQDSLNISQEFQVQQVLKQSEYEDKIESTKRAGLLSLMNELAAKGALANVDAEALEVLMKKAQETRNIFSIEKELMALSLRGLLGSQVALEAGKTKNAIDVAGLKTQNDARKLQDASAQVAKLQRIEVQMINALNLQSLTIERERLELIKQSVIEMRVLKADSEVSRIETAIALTGRAASPEDKARLETAKANQLRASETGKIETKKNESEKSVIEGFRKEVKSVIDAVQDSVLSPIQKTALKSKVDEANSIANITAAINPEGKFLGGKQVEPAIPSAQYNLVKLLGGLTPEKNFTTPDSIVNFRDRESRLDQSKERDRARRDKESRDPLRGMTAFNTDLSRKEIPSFNFNTAVSEQQKFATGEYLTDRKEYFNNSKQESLYVPSYKETLMTPMAPMAPGSGVLKIDPALLGAQKNVAGAALAAESATSINTAQRMEAEKIAKDKIAVAEYNARQAEKAAKNPVRFGVRSAVDSMISENQDFPRLFAEKTTNAFRDGLTEAMSAAISKADDLGSALRNVATGFLTTMQDAFLRNAANNITIAMGGKLFAKGGIVSGGSGYRDDVPAMLTGGEFVMRKSAVQKYGASNLERMNSGGMFVPGTRGGGAISGENDLRAFANQSTTSGATDVLKGGGSSAFVNLEDESQKLSRYALLGDSTINQEVRDAKMQAFDILKNKSDFEKQQKEREKEEKKALMKQMIATVASAALSYGAGKLAKPKTLPEISTPNLGFDSYKTGSVGTAVIAGSKGSEDLLGGFDKRWKNGITQPSPYGGAYGGMIRRYASGGPTDDIPAMLMSGEYVMNRGASRKYGKQFLDSMNQGRAPRFADGGEAAPSSPTTTTESNAKGMGDVNININVTGQTSQTESQGDSGKGGIDYKKMSEKIKMVVMETLNEEKRLGGSLRTR